MKMNFITVAKAAVLGAVLLLNSTVWAGYQSTPQVTVNPNTAFGSMVGARYSNDAVQYIGCSMYHTGLLICFARNQNGNSLTCSSSNSVMREEAQALTDSSYIYFSTDSSGTCTYLIVRDSSEHLR